MRVGGCTGVASQLKINHFKDLQTFKTAGKSAPRACVNGVPMLRVT
jgi:hypothetical protein